MTQAPGKSNRKGAVLLARTGTIGGWTLVSRILGFLRDVLLARVLGAGPLADAFFVAFKIPNFFRRMLAEGTLTVALVPVLTEARNESEEAAHRYLNALATLVLLALTAICALGVIGMPGLLLLFAPGFHDEPGRWNQALLLARWMFPYLALITLTALAWAVLNTYRRFSLAAATPALLNLAIILAALGLAPRMDNPGLALAFGVLAGGVLQLAVQIPALARIGWVWRPSFAFAQARIVETLRLFGPALVAIAAVQINVLVGTILATMLPAGAVSYLYYADRIVQLPLALFGIAMSAALLPSLSDHLTRGDREAARAELRAGIAWLTWLTLPAMAGALMLAQPIIVTLFEHGAFTHADSTATAATLQAYALGLLAFCWVKLLATACYAARDAKAPMRFAAVGVAANIVLAVLLMKPLAYVGLALATSIAAFIQAGLLYLHLKKTQDLRLDRASMLRMGAAVLACLVMLLALMGYRTAVPFPESSHWVQAVWLTGAVAGGALVFLATAWLLGERRLLDRRSAVREEGHAA